MGGWELNTREYKAQVKNDQGLIPSSVNVNPGDYKILCRGFSQCPFPCKELIGD